MNKDLEEAEALCEIRIKDEKRVLTREKKRLLEQIFVICDKSKELNSRDKWWSLYLNMREIWGIVKSELDFLQIREKANLNKGGLK